MWLPKKYTLSTIGMVLTLGLILEAKYDDKIDISELHYEVSNVDPVRPGLYLQSLGDMTKRVIMSDALKRAALGVAYFPENTALNDARRFLAKLGTVKRCDGGTLGLIRFAHLGLVSWASNRRPDIYRGGIGVNKVVRNYTLQALDKCNDYWEVRLKFEFEGKEDGLSALKAAIPDDYIEKSISEHRKDLGTILVDSFKVRIDPGAVDKQASLAICRRYTRSLTNFRDAVRSALYFSDSYQKFLEKRSEDFINAMYRYAVCEKMLMEPK